MMKRLRNNPPSPVRFGRYPRAVGLALVLSLGSGLGCGREFFREWADQDVAEAVFEKSRDPRWRLDMFSIEPPPLSRFADPYDPDRPPAPPDDRASEALSPVPQWPVNRLLVPAEGTGYLDMLAAWQRDRPAPTNPEEEANEGQGPTGVAPQPMPTPPPSSGATPFGPETPPGTGAAPGLETLPGERPELEIPDDGNLGTNNSGMTPIQSRENTPASTPIQVPNTPNAESNPPQARVKPQDRRVQKVVFQAPDTEQPDTVGELPSPAAEMPIPGTDLVREPETVPLDPDNVDLNLRAPADSRSGLSPEQYRESGGLTALLAAPALELDQAEAAGLPKGSEPFVVNPAQALTLALINNRPYQYQLEQLYIAALPVTLQRWGFSPQFFAGATPTTGTSAGLGQPNGQNSFFYRTSEVLGGQSSVLSFGTMAGFGKIFQTGASLVANFANTTVFTFNGSNPRQPRVNSFLPLSITQPFLRAGGRAVTLEPLTQAERTLLYQVRAFARFRQQFIPNILTQAQPVDSPGNTGEASIGYLNVLQQLQVVENDRKTVAVYEQLLKAFDEMSQGGGSGVSALNVDQISLSLQGARQNLLRDSLSYQNALDQFKVQLGLPPDTPLVLDKGLTEGFRDVFGQIDRWFQDPDRVPEVLPAIVEQLPPFPDILLDDKRFVEMGKENPTREDVLLTAERIALENRYDLMNVRAALYDAWRQLKVTDNALLGVFDMGISNQLLTPANTTNPFAFSDQAKQFNIFFRAELPLVRMVERNAFRSALINYRRQQRLLMAQEDAIKYTVRSEVRTLIQSAESYTIQKKQLIISLRQRDNSQRQIFAPQGPSDTGGSSQITSNTLTLVQAQNSLLGTQNTIVQLWVAYQTQRLAIYRDLGIMPYDEWEAYYELFPSESSTLGGRDPGADRPAAARPPVEAPAGR